MKPSVKVLIAFSLFAMLVACASSERQVRPKPTPVSNSQLILTESPRIQGNANIHPPRMLKASPADYPDAERRLNHEGTTMIAVRVLEDGTAGELFVYESSGWLGLDDAARGSARRSQYLPATDGNAKNISMVAIVPIVFKLDGIVRPPATAAAELTRAENVMVSYRIYERFYRDVLQACKRIGFSVDVAQTEFTRQLKLMQPKIDKFAQHYRTVVVPAVIDKPETYRERNYEILTEAYERNVNLADVASGNRDAIAYCKKATATIENGRGDFGHFDAAANQDILRVSGN